MLAHRLALMLALVGGLVPCSQATEVTLAPSPTQRCLTPAAAERGTPAYPDEEWRAGRAGRVVVELSFTTTDRRPEITVLASEGAPDFVEAVRAHVTAFRVPCLEYADIPARVRLDYVFRPTQRDTPSAQPVDPAAAERQRLLACLKLAPPAPEYPPEARRSGIQGRVLVQMTFTAPETPPTVKVLARPASKVFVDSVQEWAARQRMPCHQGLPVPTQAVLIYRMEGESRYGFRPMSLAQFVGNIREIAQQQVFFDFNTLGCPFSARLTYLQPLARNAVQEVDAPQPARAPFLAWLAAARLNLSNASLDAVFGDTLVLDIPCGKIDITPRSSPNDIPSTKEKS